MKSDEEFYSNRSFLSDVLRETVKLAAKFMKNFDEAQHLVEISSALEDLPIISTYPRELFEEEARKLGINIDEIGEKEAIRQIVMHQLVEEGANSKPKL